MAKYKELARQIICSSHVLRWPSFVIKAEMPNCFFVNNCKMTWTGRWFLSGRYRVLKSRFLLDHKYFIHSLTMFNTDQVTSNSWATSKAFNQLCRKGLCPRLSLIVVTRTSRAGVIIDGRVGEGTGGWQSPPVEQAPVRWLPRQTNQKPT